jgi:hypothetical protein
MPSRRPRNAAQNFVGYLENYQARRGDPYLPQRPGVLQINSDSFVDLILRKDEKLIRCILRDERKDIK